MKVHSRFTASVACLSAVALLSVGCTTNGSSEENPEAELFSFWYVNPLPSFQAWGASNTYFEDVAEKLGFVPTLVGPSTIDIPAMVASMEQAIADGANGILTCSLDPAAFAAPTLAAQEAGIVVISIGCIDEQADFTIGTDNDEYGRVSADLIAEAVGPDARVAILGTSAETPNQVAQVDGFEARIAEAYPDMEVLTWEYNQSDPAIAAERIQSILAAFPDVDALWMIEGAGPGVAPQALSEAGKAPGDVYVLGIDDLDPTLQAIEDGWITTTLAQCYFQASPFAAELMIAKLRGDAPSQTYWPVPVQPITVDDLPWTGCSPDSIPTL